MNPTDGRLVHSRVVSDPGRALETALDRRLTGYAVLEPQETLLLGATGRGLLALRDGLPQLAYYTGTGRGGPEALADLAEPGPYSVELYELDAERLPDADARPDRRVSPVMPAERLAGDPELAARVRALAPDDAPTGDGRPSAVEAFLADEEKIAAIRAQARDEARTRAEEWGLADELE